MNREETIFEQALGIDSPADREAWLREACAGDEPLFQSLQGLLRVHDRAGKFLDPGPQGSLNQSIGAALGAVPPRIAEKPGDRIGRYRLLEKIGEGGCGVVYMAEQEEPVRRRVALKVIKLGMDTEAVIARFEAERQALALMDHPNIAKVLDAGATENPHPASAHPLPSDGRGAGGEGSAHLPAGRLYFVMELVRGTKITEFCDHNNLTTPQRLDLFMQVCRAIQHAHQKGIIHRDIKPSNILVTLHDGVPIPKVIDFGIAKATQGRLTDKTVFTAFQQFIGTPAYMSPEQAEMTSLDIDTRSDIYSLGVLLYELLTGKTPFDSKELMEAGLDAMRRTICVQEPQRPSAKLSTMVAGVLTTTANRRQTEAPKLLHAVRGDLDWIVMKALEKDRARRYETANGLATDLQRHLDNEPVLARPPSNLYRFQKMVRRNKLAFAVGAGMLLALLFGLAICAWLLVYERQARQRAVAAEFKAKSEATKSQQVATFLQEMLQSVGPSVARGRDTTMLREVLDNAAKRVVNDLHEQPGVEADLLSTIGQVYHELGLYPQAEEMHRKALTLEKKLFGSESLEAADSLDDLGKALWKQGKPNAESTERQALAIRRKLLAGEHPKVALSLNNLSRVLLRQSSRLAEAEELTRGALAINRKALGEEAPATVQAIKNLADVVERRGDPVGAEKLYREVLDIQKRLFGDKDLTFANSLKGLAGALRDQGKLARAEDLFRQVLTLRRDLLGDAHLDVADTEVFLAMVLWSQGKLPETESLLRQALAIRENKIPDDLATFDLRSRLGRVLFEQGEQAQAESLLVSGCQGLLARETAIPPDDKVLLDTALHSVLRFYAKTNQVGEVAKLCSEAKQWRRREIKRQVVAAGSGDVRAMNNVAWFLATNEDSADRDATNAVLFADKAVAATSRRNPSFLDTLAAAYAEAGEFTNAVSIQKEAISLLQEGKEKEELASRMNLYESNRPYREP